MPDHLDVPINEPSIADAAIECRFGWGESRAVIIDRSTMSINFRRSHVPRRFLGSAEKSFTCPLTEVHSVYALHNGGLTIVTASGKAWIPANATNFREMQTTLQELVPDDKSGFATSHPMMWTAMPIAGVGGVFAGWLVTPTSATDATLAVSLLSGAFLGIATLWAIVYLGDRFLSVNLAVPLGFSASGAFIGLTVHAVLLPVLGWGSLWTLMLIGMIAGFVFGFRKQWRDKQTVNSRECQ